MESTVHSRWARRRWAWRGWAWRGWMASQQRDPSSGRRQGRPRPRPTASAIAACWPLARSWWARSRRAARQILHSGPRGRVNWQRGAVTAEYAIAMLAAVGFAGLLVVILRGDEVRGMLTDLVRNALSSQ